MLDIHFIYLFIYVDRNQHNKKIQKIYATGIFYFFGKMLVRLYGAVG